MELDPPVVGVDAHGDVDELLVDKQLEVLELALLGVALEGVPLAPWNSLPDNFNSRDEALCRKFP